MSPIRLGAVEYLNARPLVFGIERLPRFSLRFDLPSTCARLLHNAEVDLGLIPSIECLRGSGSYSIVPDLAIASRGPVASVALYTRVDLRDVQSIAMDTSSRTSVALATVLMRRTVGRAPEAVAMGPDLSSMLARADAALIIGDNALFLDHAAAGVTKVDLGELWTATTGLPFVYAFWAGRPGVVTAEDIELLQRARDEGVRGADVIAREYFGDRPDRQAIAVSYLRDNIQYSLGRDEMEGLVAFYRYAAEAGLASFDGTLTFYDARYSRAR